MDPPVGFRVAWLLLLLSDGFAHGYELNRAQPVRSLCRDGATTYRTLRKMEAQGLVESCWTPSRAAPPRRVYAITSAGRTELARLADDVRTLRDAHDGFLSAYEGLVRQESDGEHRPDEPSRV